MRDMRRHYVVSSGSSTHRKRNIFRICATNMSTDGVAYHEQYSIVSNGVSVSVSVSVCLVIDQFSCARPGNDV